MPKTRIEFKTIDEALSHQKKHGGRVVVNRWRPSYKRNVTTRLLWFSYHYTQTEICEELKGCIDDMV